MKSLLPAGVDFRREALDETGNHHYDTRFVEGSPTLMLEWASRMLGEALAAILKEKQ